MKTRWIALLSLMILTTACFSEKNKPDLIKEDPIKENLHLSGFNIIHTSASIHVMLKEGDKESVIRVSNPCYQIQVFISVEGGVLKVKVKGKIIKAKGFKTLLTLKKQKNLDSSAYPNISTGGILTFSLLNLNRNGASPTPSPSPKERGIKDLNINAFNPVDCYLSNQVSNIESLDTADGLGTKFKAKKAKVKPNDSEELVTEQIKISKAINVDSSDLKKISHDPLYRYRFDELQSIIKL